MRFPESILTDDLVRALERDPSEVRDAVCSGRISLEQAAWTFGVVFHGQPEDPDFRVDRDATLQRRNEIRIAGAPPGGA